MVLLKLVTLTTIITFLWSGLTINFLQLINYVLLRRLNFKLFTQVNYFLMYSAWSQIVALFDWFFASEFTVYHSKKEDKDKIFKEHNIFLANHGYELDWVGAWLVTDKYSQLASCKAMLKSDLKYIPVVGWSWAMSDQLFLARNWEKDKHKIGVAVDTLLRYDPMIATFFCEGTRFCKEKAQECQDFAAERGIVAPKYHLIPRTKGFVAVVRHLKQKQLADPNLKIFIYNTQIAYDERAAMTISDVIQKGLKPVGHLYFERISIDEIPNDDDGCAKWLQDLYVRKDELHEHFIKTHSFPGYIDDKLRPYSPRWSTIANWLGWTIYTFLPQYYLIVNLYDSYGAFPVSIVMSTFFVLSYLYLNWIMYQAEAGDETCATGVKQAETTIERNTNIAHSNPKKSQ